MNGTERLRDLIAASSKVAVFTGAGISNGACLVILNFKRPSN
jgi:NAD-dependent SIR2 family protein deacetylase